MELRGLEPLTPTLPVRSSRRLGTPRHLGIERKRAGHRLECRCSGVISRSHLMSAVSASPVTPDVGGSDTSAHTVARHGVQPWSPVLWCAQHRCQGA